jgi:hypothetical protein
MMRTEGRMVGDEPRHTGTPIWVVTAVYEGDSCWSDPAAFTTRDHAVAALERFHRTKPFGEHDPDVLPIVWYSVWPDEVHGENDDRSCPGWPTCDQCDDWRGFVGGVPWYRLEQIMLYDGREPEHWGHFSGVSLLSDSVDYLWPLKVEGG